MTSHQSDLDWGHAKTPGRRGSMSNQRSGHDILHDSAFTTSSDVSAHAVLTDCERGCNNLILCLCVCEYNC